MIHVQADQAASGDELLGGVGGGTALDPLSGLPGGPGSAPRPNREPQEDREVSGLEDDDEVRSLNSSSTDISNCPDATIAYLPDLIGLANCGCHNDKISQSPPCFCRISRTCSTVHCTMSWVF